MLWRLESHHGSFQVPIKWQLVFLTGHSLGFPEFEDRMGQQGTSHWLLMGKVEWGKGLGEQVQVCDQVCDP